MIIISERLRDYIEGFGTKEEAAEALGVSIQTLYNHLRKEGEVSANFIEQVKQRVGWDFEKAFEIKND